MMKKMLAFILVAAMATTFSACGNGDAANSSGSNTSTGPQETTAIDVPTELSIEEKYQYAVKTYEAGLFEEASLLFHEFDALLDCPKDVLDAAIALYNDGNEDEARRLYPDASLLIDCVDYYYNSEAMRIVQGQWVAYCYADGDAYSDRLTSDDFKDWSRYYGKANCARQLLISGWECSAPNYHSYVYGTTNYTYYGFSARTIEVIDGVVSVPMYSNDFTYSSSTDKKELGVPVLDASGTQLYYSLTRDGDGLVNIFTGFRLLDDGTILFDENKTTFGCQWGYFKQDTPVTSNTCEKPGCENTVYASYTSRYTGKTYRYCEHHYNDFKTFEDAADIAIDTINAEQ